MLLRWLQRQCERMLICRSRRCFYLLAREWCSSASLRLKISFDFEVELEGRSGMNVIVQWSGRRSSLIWECGRRLQNSRSKRRRCRKLHIMTKHVNQNWSCSLSITIYASIVWPTIWWIFRCSCLHNFCSCNEPSSCCVVASISGNDRSRSSAVILGCIQYV